MATSVHIPKPLLEELDRRARSLKISRNRFIVQTLAKQLAREVSWSPGFFDELEEIEPKDVETIDEMLAVIHKSRRSKKAPHL